MAFALASEKLGIFLAENWENYGFSDNYFDDTGVFVLFFFALPPIFTCIFLLSHLIGRIGGRMIDRYVGQNQVRKAKKVEEKPSEEEEKNEAKDTKADEKEKTE
jgi:hypothetical protein